MKAKLMYIIKHNQLIRSLYVFFGSLFLRLLGCFLPVDPKLVLLVSNGGNSYSGSVKTIYEYLKEHEEYKDLKLVYAFNQPEKYSFLDAEIIRFDSLTYFKTALKAGYWITDNNIDRNLHFKKKKTKYLNTWHGIAIKKIGNDHKDSGHYKNSNIDYLCVSGSHDEKVYSSALSANPESFLRCGMPRNDELYHTSSEDRIRIREKLGIPEDKKMILYAPTWRESVNGGQSYDLRLPVDFTKWEERLGDDYLLFFRAHDRTTKLMNIRFNDFIHDANTYEPLNDLLIAADVLITDYSSIIFDYAILEKPAVCFCYDLEEYGKERGMYFDPLETLPCSVLKTEEEVLEHIRTMDYAAESQYAKEIKEMFTEYCTGHAAEICVHTLFSAHTS